MTETPPPFEERIARYQRPGDGAYLMSHWDRYTTKACRELCGVVSALATTATKPAPGERLKIRLLDYVCSSGALFRALDHYLGHLIDFSFVGVDMDRRALGFVRAKWPDTELHEADGIRLLELQEQTPIAADIAVVVSSCYCLPEEEVRRIVQGLSRAAPTLIIADQVDNFLGTESRVMELLDSSGRTYEAECHAFGHLLSQAGYTDTASLPANEPFKSITGYVIASTHALPPRETLEKHLADSREAAFAQAAERRRTKSTTGAPASRVNSVSYSIKDVVKEITARQFRTVSVCGDKQFSDDFGAALHAAMEHAETAWYSGNFADVEQGARMIDASTLRSDCVVVGGPHAHFYHPRILRVMSRVGTVRPVLPVADKWEFCLGQLSLPGKVEGARAYLFNHFQEYFGIRDPILARLEAYDHDATHETWILLQPGESIEIELDTYLPGRKGPAVISVYTCAPVLTRGRHFRWRFCADAEWGGSIATLHGTHDVPHASATTEFIQSRTSFGSGRIVFTLPNHYGDMAEKGVVVDCVDGSRRFQISRDRTSRIEEVELSLNNTATPSFGDYIGCRFGQYCTPYWFGFENGAERKILSANHIQGQSFEFLTKAPPAVPLGELEQSLIHHDIVTWPYCVPVLPVESGLEVGLSFDSSWPVLRKLMLRFFDSHGRLLLCERWTKDRPGLVFTDELLRNQTAVPVDAIEMIVVSPDWEGMNLDQQKNGISPIVELALRHRETGDYDITEFQNSWRNLGVVVDEMPHWIHFSNHLLGGTNLYGRALARDGWRIGALLVNGSGNLKHDVEIDYVVKLFDRTGCVREAAGALEPFTHRLIWLDEIFPDLRSHLGDGGYGAMVIRSRNGDLNGQLVTVKDNQSVSLQHMWGY